MYEPRWLPNTICPKCCKCFTDRSRSIGGVNNFRGHKKPSSRASGDDSKRIYLHKNQAARETWLERGSQGDFGDPFLPKTRNACKNKICFYHADCEVSELCESCFREGTHHNVPGFNEYNCYRRFSIPCEDEVEHAWIDCLLRGLNPAVELRYIYFSDSDSDSEIL